MEPRWVWPFELIEKIGEGGMGIVYRARYSGNDRIVAVKLLPTEVAADPVLLARFERELDVLKQLKHPNIVRCFGGTCESTQRFYAMELVDGGTLADLLEKKGHLSWEFVVDYALQMCEALQYAHEHGVIHRDVKPGNFLLTKSGNIKLSDFGLAAIATAHRLTAAGRTVGTIQYMAPEQIRGKPALDGRADLYALGCVLYEMLTGQPPYAGENAAAVLQQHLSAPIPHAAAIMLECPLKLDQLICDLMSKDADQRPATAAEVGWRLEEILQPGRRGAAVEPELFMSRTKVVEPLQDVAHVPSDDAIPVSTGWGSQPWLSWGVAAVLLLFCAGLWIRSSAIASQLAQAERYWVKLFEGPDLNLRLVAAEAIADFGPIRWTTIQSLNKATADPNPAVRLAAVKAMGKHASECRSFQGEMLHLEKVDDHPEVRHQAGLALEAMKHAPAEFSIYKLLAWVAFLAVVVFVGINGWNLWQRLKLSAAA